MFLRRDQAPISQAAWTEVDEEAKRTLRLHLEARKLVDFHGPTGWEDACVNLGRTTRTTGLAEAVETRARRVQPLLELRVPFTLSRDELEDVDRGCQDPDLEPVVQAAKALARAEGALLFEGHADSEAVGIVRGSPHEPLALGDDPEAIPGATAEATGLLRSAGVEGPYGIALGPRGYKGLVQAPASGGYPALDRLRNVVSGPIVWSPVLEGAVVASVRGGDYALHVGQDASIDYLDHTAGEIRLLLLETVTLRVLTPEAAVGLRYED